MEHAELTSVAVLIRAYAIRATNDEHNGKTDSALNKAKFEKHKALSTKAAHVVFETGHAVTSIKTWGDNGFKSGLNSGQATALAKSCKSLTDEVFGKITTATKDDCRDAIIEVIANLTADDDDEEVIEEEDSSSALDELLVEDDDDDDGASVELASVSMADIEAVLNGKPTDALAYINGAMLAFKDDANRHGKGFNLFLNGKQNNNGKQLPKGSLAEFLAKVANMAGLNMAGLAAWRGGRGDSRDWGSDLCIDAVEGEKFSPIQKLGIAWCVIAFKADVKVFNHDLRKYISDATSEALFDLCIDSSADLSHDAAPTNGWRLPYQRGDGAWKTSTKTTSALDTLLL